MEWLAAHWFDCIQIVGIVGGLWFTAFSLRSETKTRRVANLLTITANYRETWKHFSENPALVRVLDASPNTREKPITNDEAVFVNMVMFHINTVYYAMKDGLMIKMEGLRRDVAGFLSLPIPRAMWDEIKMTQNDDFVAFVESCRNWK